MNKQEIFDKVKTHLLRQGKKSLGTVRSEGRVPRYKNDEGLTCAIGCLLDSDAYSEELEGRSVSEPMVEEALRKSGVVPEHVDDYTLLRELQKVHDISPPEWWERKLWDVAQNFDLEWKL